MLVRLLGRELLHAGLVLGFGLRLLDFAMANRFEPRGLFTLALLFRPASLLFRSQARLLGGAALGLLTSAPLGFRPSPAVPLLFLLFDPVLLEAHELFEREENGAFFLFGHRRFLNLARQRVGPARIRARTSRIAIAKACRQALEP